MFSAVSDGTKKNHTVQIGHPIYSCLEFYFLMRNGCALYKRWQFVALEKLLHSFFFFFFFLQKDLPAFTSLLELSFGPVVLSTRASVSCIVLKQ